MPNTVVTTAEAHRVLTLAVDTEGPDHKSPCFYRADLEDDYHNGNPLKDDECCIAGWVMRGLGMDLKQLPTMLNSEGFNDPNVQVWIDEQGFTLTEGAIKLVRDAQMAQDDNESWGSSLIDAEAKSGIDPLGGE